MKNRSIAPITLSIIALAWIGVFYASGRDNTLALALGALSAVAAYTTTRRRPSHH